MPIKKVKEGGNMYQGWVTHTHSHLGGECSHGCTYCYVQRNRFGVHPRYQGEPRLIEHELNVDYSKKWVDNNGITITEKIIFIEHMNDLFAESIPDVWIMKILRHCLEFEHNKYVFQSKNISRVLRWTPAYFLDDVMFGTTIETDLDTSDISKAPHPITRLEAITELKRRGYETFITIEPIMNFSLGFAKLIIDANPDFVNIGADSKRCKLSEPAAEVIKQFIEILQRNNITIKRKTNLKRLLNV